MIINNTSNTHHCDIYLFTRCVKVIPQHNAGTNTFLRFYTTAAVKPWQSITKKVYQASVISNSKKVCNGVLEQFDNWMLLQFVQTCVLCP